MLQILLSAAAAAPLALQVPAPQVTSERATWLVNFHEMPEEPLLEWIERDLRGVIEHRYQTFPAIAAHLDSAALDALELRPEVSFVEPDQIVEIENVNQTWGVETVGGGLAHAMGFFGNGIKVGVIDTGIDYNHPQLSAVYVDGYDFVFNDPDPIDDHGHGTHVSGTIAAAVDGVGVAGLAPNVRMWHAKCFNFFGSGAMSDILAGVDYMTTEEVDIVNNSWGGFFPTATLEIALQNALAAGVIHIAAAGNFAGLGGVKYPARYPETYAISAIDDTLTIAGFSDRGPQIDFAAPGVNVLSTQLGGGYVAFDGTSMACPHAVGVAALALGSGTIVDLDGDGNLFNELKERMELTAVDLGRPGEDNLYGAGMVNAHGVLAEPIRLAASNVAAGSTATVDASGGTPGDTMYLAVSGVGPGYRRLDGVGMVTGLRAPTILGSMTVDAAGNASFTATVPVIMSGRSLWLQSGEPGSTNVSAVLRVDVP